MPTRAPEHSGAGHIWSLCLAILLAGLAVLAQRAVNPEDLGTALTSLVQ